MSHRRKKNALLKPATLGAIAGIITAVGSVMALILPHIHEFFPPPTPHPPPNIAMVAGTLLIDKNKPAKDVPVVLDRKVRNTTDSEGEFVFAKVITDMPHYFEVYQGDELKYHKNFPVEGGKGVISLGTFTIGDVGAQTNPPPAPTVINKKPILPVVQNESANKAQFANVSKQASYDVSLVESGEIIPKDQMQPGSNPYRFTFSINASRQTISQITSVTYYLHPTFNPSVVTKTSATDNFALSFTGWGKFDLRAKVYFKDGQIKDLVFPADKWTLNEKQPQKMTPTVQYKFVRMWGSPGSANGQFHSPHGIAVDPAKNVYVADTGNNRIEKFNSNGTFITSWGSEGIEYAQFRSPKGIAVDSDGDVYIADSGNNRIQKFDTTTNVTFITAWGTTIPVIAQFIDPESVAVDQSGNNAYVADTGNNVIKAFELTSGCPPITQIVPGVCSKPLGFNSDLSSPRGIAVDSSHNVYVADTGNNRILKFDSNGTFITSWGSPGTDDGQFTTPSDVAVDQSGNNVYVADSGNNRVEKFDSNGTFITSWGSPGSANGQFLFPAGVGVDQSGNVYVADRGNNRIQVFAPSTNIPSR